MAKVTIKKFDFQSGSDRTLYITWTFGQHSKTDHYRVVWQYLAGGTWFDGSDSEVDTKQSTYDAPENATKVRVKVKPVPKKSSSYTGKFTAWKTKKMSKNDPDDGEVPDVELDGLTLTASLANISGTATHIQFQIVVNDSSNLTTSSNLAISKSSVTWTYKSLSTGKRYKVRSRGYNSKTKDYGDWSDYSDNVYTQPAKPTSVSVTAASSDSVTVKWSSSADEFEIQYATTKDYLTTESGDVQSQSGITSTSGYTITGLSTGYEYFFRVRATIDESEEESDWSSIVSCVLGREPSAPTTWSSTTTAYVGEEVVLYWVHNAQDGSSQTYAQIELTIGDNDPKTTLYTNSTEEFEKDLTSHYEIDTSSYTEGTTILWRVQTKGIYDKYSDWSIMRTINVYAKPTLELRLIDSTDTDLSTVTQFPFYISGVPGPATQSPISYHVEVTSLEDYETVDSLGNDTYVSENQVLFSKYYDTDVDLMLEMSPSNIDLEGGITYKIKMEVCMNTGLTAEETLEFDVDWDEELYEPDAAVEYDSDLYCANIRPYCYAIEDKTVIVNRLYYWVLLVDVVDIPDHSSSTATGETVRDVNTDVYYGVNSDGKSVYYTVYKDEYRDLLKVTYFEATNTTIEIADTDEIVYTTWSVSETGDAVYYIKDDNGDYIYFCYTEEIGDLIENVTLSVYRREYNGEYVEIGTGIANDGVSYVTDPHPALDYARYRVIAVSSLTGSISYNDVGDLEVGETSIVIQWDEDWSDYVWDADTDDKLADSQWSGSRVILPYNIDISDQNDPDVTLVDYIGRSRPVSYYGTHVNETSTWNSDIPKYDTDTIYALRRLALYMGDVYVREPSGSGYWANIQVSFNITHKELVVPVTLTITRVEGGV